MIFKGLRDFLGISLLRLVWSSDGRWDSAIMCVLWINGSLRVTSTLFPSTGKKVYISLSYLMKIVSEDSSLHVRNGFLCVMFIVEEKSSHEYEKAKSVMFMQKGFLFGNKKYKNLKRKFTYQCQKKPPIYNTFSF